MQHIGDIIKYKKTDYQVVGISDATEPHSMGEQEILYKCMTRHGEIRDILDWELAIDNSKRKWEAV
jgi:hypothetical protein